MATERFCQKCGSRSGDGDTYCKRCGTMFAVPDANIPEFAAPPGTTRNILLRVVGFAAVVGIGLSAYSRYGRELLAEMPTLAKGPAPTAVPTPVTPTTVPAPPALTGDPRRLIIDAAGGGDFRAIGPAIKVARPLDTIVVRPGTYRETVMIDRDVQVIGEGGRENVVIEGSYGSHVITITKGSATLKGLTIRLVGSGDTSVDYSALRVSATTHVAYNEARRTLPMIEDCDVMSQSGTAVSVFGEDSNPTFRNCLIHDSQFQGILVDEHGAGLIETCQISRNRVFGVVIRPGAQLVMRNCVFTGNEIGGIMVWAKGYGTFTNCRIIGLSPWEIQPGSTVTRTGNVPNA